jgi:hypothetical protein
MAVPKSYVGTITAATNIEAQPVNITGLLINATTGSTVTLWDNATAAASGPILFQKTFAAAAIYQLPAPTGFTGIRAVNGVTITVAGAAAQTTLVVG